MLKYFGDTLTLFLNGLLKKIKVYTRKAKTNARRVYLQLFCRFEKKLQIKSQKKKMSQTQIGLKKKKRNSIHRDEKCTAEWHN